MSAQDSEIESLRARVAALEAVLSAMTQAVGLATTCVPSMEINPDDPIGMMHRVCAEFDALRAELDKRRAAKP